MKGDEKVAENKNGGFSWTDEKNKTEERIKGSSQKSGANPFAQGSDNSYFDIYSGSYDFDFSSSDDYIYNPSGFNSSYSGFSQQQPRNRSQGSSNGKKPPERPNNQRNGAARKNPVDSEKTAGKNKKTAKGSEKSSSSRQPQKTKASSKSNDKNRSQSSSGKKASASNKGRSSQGSPSQKSSAQKSKVTQQKSASKGKGSERTNREKQQQKAQKLHEQNKKQSYKTEKEFRRLITEEGMSENEALAYLAKKKKIKRKVNSVFCVLGVLATVLVGILIFCFAKGFPIATIEINGNKIYKDSEILKIADVAVGDNMLLIRQKKTNKSVSRELPYIESVEVDYVLPDKLVLNVTETSDKYYIVSENSYVCLDENSKVVSVSKKKLKKGVYKLLGMEKEEAVPGTVFVPSDKNGNKEKLALAKEIAEAAKKVGIENCNIIDFSKMKEIKISCSDIITIVVDTKTPLERRFILIKDDLENRVANKRNATYDLRFSDQAVVSEGNE